MKKVISHDEQKKRSRKFSKKYQYETTYPVKVTTKKTPEVKTIIFAHNACLTRPDMEKICREALRRAWIRSIAYSILLGIIIGLIISI